MADRIKVSCIGIGRLGICLALCMENAGCDVVGVDLNPSYIDALNNKTFRSREPRVNEFLDKSTKFRASTSLVEGVEHSDILFILCATPSGGGRRVYDHTALNNILGNLNKMKLKNKHVVICCTVLPGYCDQIGNGLLSACENTSLSYNPEFIAQGDVIAGLLKPDIVLIGEGNKDAGDRLEAIYRAVDGPHVKICRMSPSSAEICKLSVNCFVTTKISFANMVGDIADRTPGANKFDILNGVGSDSRVGLKYLRPGYGFGGPCFPRDNRALGDYAQRVGISPLVSIATDKYNDYHAELQTKELLEKNLPLYVFEDVAYKPNCPVDIVEESAKLVIAEKLVRAGKQVLIKDRRGIIDECRKEYGRFFQYEVTSEE